jgi:hypothetical protein
MKLSDRVEALTGPSRAIDADIHAIVCNSLVYVSDAYPAPSGNGRVVSCYKGGGHGTSVSPRYTASIDSAMTIVPKAWSCFHVDATAPECGIDWVLHGPQEELAKGAALTPALALTAAALRSRGL